LPKQTRGHVWQTPSAGVSEKQHGTAVPAKHQRLFSFSHVNKKGKSKIRVT
jgi:hypothetical protein